MCRLKGRQNERREQRPPCQLARKAARKDNRETERVDTIKTKGHNSSFSYIPPLYASLASCAFWLALMLPLYFTMSHLPGLACHFRLSAEPQKSHYNPQILLNMTMCHSSCHTAACFERGAEGKCICTIVNSVNNNSFGAFSLCAKCKQELSPKKPKYSSKLQPGTWNN